MTQKWSEKPFSSAGQNFCSKSFISKKVDKLRLKINNSITFYALRIYALRIYALRCVFSIAHSTNSTSWKGEGGIKIEIDKIIFILKNRLNNISPTKQRSKKWTWKNRGEQSYYKTRNELFFSQNKKNN